MVDRIPALLSLTEIQTLVESLARQICVPADLLPTFGQTMDGARPHIETDLAYHRVVVERGKEIDRKTTQELDELLYWIFRSITSTMAADFELQNRIDGCSPRRLMFRKQLELLGALKRSWEEKRRIEIREILKENPFDDGKDENVI